MQVLLGPGCLPVPGVEGRHGDVQTLGHSRPRRANFAGDGPARILEIISPAGFETFFEEMTELASRGVLGPDRMVSLAAEYGAEVDDRPAAESGATRSLSRHRRRVWRRH